MAWFIECPFCHKSVFRWFYSWHESKHTERRPDGQMNEHITLSPQKRYDGSLAGIPQAYRHAECGVVTAMPEEIIRTYLVEPLTYSDNSFCCGCGDYIVSSELTWIETNEPVMSYMGRLRCDYVRKSFGIEPNDLEIVVTPRALQMLQRVAEEAQTKEPYFVALLYVPSGSSVNYSLDLATNWDPQFEELVPSSGIDVVIRKDQKRKLLGTVIDFNESGVGFVIARLATWA